MAGGRAVGLRLSHTIRLRHGIGGAIAGQTHPGNLPRKNREELKRRGESLSTSQPAGREEGKESSTIYR